MKHFDRPFLTEDPKTLAEAKQWLVMVEGELHKATAQLHNTRAFRQDLSEAERVDWKKRLHRWNLHLSRRRKYLKAKCHELSFGVRVPLAGLRGEEALRAHNEIQEQVATARRAMRQAAVAERNRQRRVVAHYEGTTNPYLLLGATKGLVEHYLDYIEQHEGQEARAGILSVEDMVLLANVRDVLRSATARESIDRYVATKIGEIEALDPSG